MTDYDACAAGNPRFQQLDPAQFAPRGPVVRTEKSMGGRTVDWKVCHLCSQQTMVKLDGFFVSHSASVKGAIPQGFKGNTQYSNVPPRVRGRRA